MAKPSVPDPSATFNGAVRRDEEISYPNLDQAFEPPTPPPAEARDFSFPDELSGSLPDDRPAGGPLSRLIRWLSGK